MSMTSQNFETYVPVYDVVPEKWEDAKAFINEQLRRLANAVNIREIGWLLNEELLSGKQFFPGTNSPNTQTYRSVFRKVINFGALPNAGLKSVAHGITLNSNFSLTHLYAGATKPTVAFAALQIPFSSPTLNKNIQLDMDATNINITTAIDYSAYTRCYVVVEYLQEQ